ncbi:MULTISPECIES: cytochrome P450 [unclassified Streptomyces]|uniref:cytochrome P450 n=1 Tax=unclassified Streptomyces TaxID=2593676 RepID=UPI002E17FD9A|nr:MULTISPECIES: cytochrome P450 [unclassified Streptomyces]
MTEPLPPGFPLERPATAPLDPPPSHLQLRTDQRLARVSIYDGRLQPYLVTRYEDARAVLGSDAFSTDPTPRPGMPEFPSWREGQQQGPRGFFKSYDEPVHSLMRKALTREFMVKRINALRPGIERLTGELLDEMTAKGSSADLVEQFALPLPSLVICDLLGVPYEDHDFFQQHAKVFVDFAATPDQVVQAQKELGEYLDVLVARKRAEPGDDVVTRLAGQVDAGAISARDAADLAAFVLFAGHETTANMISLSVVALLHNPDQIPTLLAGPQEAANATEELLRYLTIVHGGVRRYTVKEVEIAGITLQPGDGVIVPLGLANRDPEVFGDPDRLDLQRANARQHVAFSYGIHQCLGQPLARAEMQIVLPEIFRRLPDLRITVPLDEIDFKQNTFVYGLNSLPITW